MRVKPLTRVAADNLFGLVSQERPEKLALAGQDSGLNRVEQVFPANRLPEELDRSGLERATPRSFIAFSGDKNDRDAATLPIQALLQLESIHPGQAHVQYQAIRGGQGLRRKELFGRSECLDFEANRAHEALERLTDGRIIIHNRNAAHRVISNRPCASAFHNFHLAYSKRAFRRITSYIGRRGLLRFRSGVMQAFRHPDQVGERIGVHFLHHVSAVSLDG